MPGLASPYGSRTVRPMPSLGGIKKRAKQLKPHVQSAFIVYVTPRKSPAAERVEEEFEVVEITSADDPLLERITAKWQLPWAKSEMANGTLTIIVATKDGEPIGRIWDSDAPYHKSLTSGVPRMRLAKDEFF